MAGTFIKIDIDDGGVLQAFNRLIAFGDNPSPALKSIGEYFARRTEERFDAETGPGGAKWAELSPATRARKRHPKILTESGMLRGSFHPEYPDEHTLEFGTNVIYAAIHQAGGTIERAAHSTHVVQGKGGRFVKGSRVFGALAPGAKRVTVGAHAITIPARPILGIDSEDSAEIVEIFREELERQAGGGRSGA